MYEVTCPGCARDYDVADDAAEGACPDCHLKVELLTEQEARRRGVAVPEPRPEAPPAAEPEPDDEFVEVPCPACDGPLLLADEDTEGMCPHCRILLVFDHGTARVVEPEPEAAPVVLAPPAPATEVPIDESPSEQVTVPPRFDPTLVVTSDTAPLVTCRSVAPPMAAADGPDPGARPGDDLRGGAVSPRDGAEGEGELDLDVDEEADRDALKSHAALRMAPGPALLPAAPHERSPPPFTAPEGPHMPMVVTSMMAPLVEVGPSQVEPAQGLVGASGSKNGTTPPSTVAAFPTADGHVSEVFAALARDRAPVVEDSFVSLELEPDVDLRPDVVDETLVGMEPGPETDVPPDVVEEAFLALAHEPELVQPDAPDESIVAFEVEPEPEVVSDPEHAPVVAPVVKSAFAADPSLNRPLASDEAPLVEVGESKVKPTTPPKPVTAPASPRPKKGQPVERVVDPDRPDGIPLAVHGKPIKDITQSRVVDCPECTQPFRHHVRDADLQCPHCGRYFEVMPDEEVAPPPAEVAVAWTAVGESTPAEEVELEEEPVMADISEPEMELDLARESLGEPVVAAQPEPGSDLEEEPEFDFESEPDVAEGPLVALEPEQDVEPELEDEPLMAKEPEPEGDLDEEPDFVLESGPDVEEARLVVAEPDDDVEPELEEEPDFVLESEPEVEEEPVPTAEPEPEMDLEEEPELDLEPEPEWEEQPLVASGPEPEPDHEEEPELDLEPEPESEAEPLIAAEVHAEEPEPLAGPALESFDEDEDVDDVPAFGVEEVGAEGDAGTTRTVARRDR